MKSSEVRLIFQHGYALTDLFWKNLKPLVEDFYECVFLNAGYYGNRKVDVKKSDKKDIIIGHSIGFAKLVDRVDLNPVAAVSFGGFAKYVNSQAISQALVNLNNLLKDDVKKTLAVNHGFLCNLPSEFSQEVMKDNFFDTELIFGDLNLLGRIDVTEKLEKNSYPILHLVGAKDVAIDNKKLLIKREFEMHEFKDQTHGLGYHGAELCFEKVKNFIEKI